MGLKDKIEARLDELQEIMESNTHLEDKEKTSALVYSISKFWSALNEEDRDYINAVRVALEDDLPWNV